MIMLSLINKSISKFLILYLYNFYFIEYIICIIILYLQNYHFQNILRFVYLRWNNKDLYRSFCLLTIVHHNNCYLTNSIFLDQLFSHHKIPHHKYLYQQKYISRNLLFCHQPINHHKYHQFTFLKYRVHIFYHLTNFLRKNLH